jgi:hypothetical protein
MNQLHCLQARTTRGCQQRQHALTPNVDRFEIHPPVSTGPQWGQRSGTVLPWSKTQAPVSPAVRAGFLSAGTTHIECAGPGFVRAQEPDAVAGSKAQGASRPGQGRSQPQAAGWCLITVNRHDFTCENCKDSASKSTLFRCLYNFHK